MIDIDKLEQAALAATQGEWEFWQGYVATDIDSEGKVILCERPRPNGGKFQKAIDNNFKFIATANPSAVLELITRLRAAEKDSARLNSLSSEMNRTVHYLTGKWYWSRKPYKTYMRKESIREAIDAAMKEKP